jgi:hypothetical protein
MRARRIWILGLGAVMAAAMSAAIAAPASADQDTGARDEAPADIGVGTRLEALDDVTVARAEIAKGSKVSVTRLVHRQGRVAGVDVELADGQIARVGIDTVRSFFRVLGD